MSKNLEGVEVFQTPEGVASVDEHVRTLDPVADGVFGLRTVMVNLYAVAEHDGEWVIIDTGLPGSAHHVMKWMKTHGFKGDPSAIILTHGHFDHTGAVEDLAKQWNVPVFAHALEIPYLTGQSVYPPPDAKVGGGLMSLLSPFYPRKGVDLSGRVSALPDDGTVPGLPSWRWIHTPGHADGHVSLFRERDGTLLAGDAVTTTKQESLSAILSQRAELHGPPAYFTPDWKAAKASVRKLTELQPEVVAAGHGKPVTGVAAREGLLELADHFDQLAVPKKGKYVTG